MEKEFCKIIEQLNPIQTIIIISVAIGIYFKVKKLFHDQTKIINGLGQRLEKDIKTGTKTCDLRHKEYSTNFLKMKDEIRGKLSIVDIGKTFKKMMQEMQSVAK